VNNLKTSKTYSFYQVRQLLPKADPSGLVDREPLSSNPALPRAPPSWPTIATMTGKVFWLATIIIAQALFSFPKVLLLPSKISERPCIMIVFKDKKIKCKYMPIPIAVMNVIGER